MNYRCAGVGCMHQQEPYLMQLFNSFVFFNQTSIAVARQNVGKVPDPDQDQLRFMTQIRKEQVLYTNKCRGIYFCCGFLVTGNFVSSILQLVFLLAYLGFERNTIMS